MEVTRKGREQKEICTRTITNDEKETKITPLHYFIRVYSIYFCLENETLENRRKGKPKDIIVANLVYDVYT